MRLGLHRAVFQLSTAVVIFTAAGVGEARAQIRHIDYTTMNQQVSSKSAASFYMDPSTIANQVNPGMQKFIGRAPNMDKFLTINHATLPKGNVTLGTSSMNGKMDESPLWQKMYANPGNLTQKMYPQSAPSSPQMDTALQRYSTLNDFTQESQLRPHSVGPSKFTDAFVFHTADNNSKLEEVGRELSLQDINRYQFQGSHSGEPGLPTVHAGGTTDQPVFAGSPLTSGPATFDGAALQSNRVLSGTSDQMRIITPNGVRPYQPMQFGSSNSESAKSSSASSNYDTVYSKAQQVGANKSTNSLPSGAAFMPSGAYTPVTSEGNQVPVSFDTPKMIIQVKKGGFVRVGDDPAQSPVAQQ